MRLYFISIYRETDMNNKKKPSPTEIQRRRRIVKTVFLILPFLFLIVGIALLLCTMLNLFPDDSRLLMTFVCAGFVDAAVILVAVRSMLLVTVNEASGLRKFLSVLIFIVFLALTVFSHFIWHWIYVYENGVPSPLGSLGSLSTWTTVVQIVRFAFLVMGLLMSLSKEPDTAPKK